MSPMLERIAAALDRVQQDHGVHIVLAIESGSRAWGFPSKDSDWDVRFIYHHPLPRYVALQPPRDVIELPLSGDLDVGGWDIRKALALIVGSNAVALEWLQSPVVYRRDPDFADALTALATEAAHRPALRYHYDRLARRYWPPSDPGAIRSKHLLYALRPACALAWLRRHDMPPRMDLPSLMAGLALAPELSADIRDLIARKRDEGEADMTHIPATIAAFITTALSDPAARVGPWDRSGPIERADRLLLQLLDGRTEPAS